MRLDTLRAQLILILCSFLAVTLGALGLFINGFNQAAIFEQTRDREELFTATCRWPSTRCSSPASTRPRPIWRRLPGASPACSYIEIVEAKIRPCDCPRDPRRVGTIESVPVYDGRSLPCRARRPWSNATRGPTAGPFTTGPCPTSGGTCGGEGIIRVGAVRRARGRAQAAIARLHGAVDPAVFDCGPGARRGHRLPAHGRAQGHGRVAASFGEGRYDARVVLPDKPRDELDRAGDGPQRDGGAHGGLFGAPGGPGARSHRGARGRQPALARGRGAPDDVHRQRPLSDLHEGHPRPLSPRQPGHGPHLTASRQAR